MGNIYTDRTAGTVVQAAKKAVDASASAVSKTSFAMVIDLLLGAIAAALGGALAIQRRVLGTFETVRPVTGAR